MKINSLYICVKDMNRAIKFYEDLFEIKVTKKDDLFSIFDLSGFHFCLFNYQKTNEPHQYGNSCLPSLEVKDLETLQTKLKKIKVVFPLTVIGKNYVAEFIDSEGNQIEITAPKV